MERKLTMKKILSKRRIKARIKQGKFVPLNLMNKYDLILYVKKIRMMRSNEDDRR